MLLDPEIRGVRSIRSLKAPRGSTMSKTKPEFRLRRTGGEKSGRPQRPIERFQRLVREGTEGDGG